MRRLLLLGGLAALAWRLVRGRGADGTAVSVGFADGSAVDLAAGDPTRERLLAAAREALGP